MSSDYDRNVFSCLSAGVILRIVVSTVLPKCRTVGLALSFFFCSSSICSPSLSRGSCLRKVRRNWLGQVLCCHRFQMCTTASSHLVCDLSLSYLHQRVFISFSCHSLHLASSSSIAIYTKCSLLSWVIRVDAGRRARSRHAWF